MNWRSFSKSFFHVSQIVIWQNWISFLFVSCCLHIRLHWDGTAPLFFSASLSVFRCHQNCSLHLLIILPRSGHRSQESSSQTWPHIRITGGAFLFLKPRPYPDQRKSTSEGRCRHRGLWLQLARWPQCAARVEDCSPPLIPSCVSESPGEMPKVNPNLLQWASALFFYELSRPSWPTPVFENPC